MHTVLFLFEPNSIWNAEIERLRADYPKVRIVVGPKPAAADLEAATLMVAYRVDPALYNQLTALTGLVCPGTGVNQFPLEELARRNIALANTHFNGRYVAERALALMLAWCGKIVAFHNDLARGVWHGFSVREPVQDSWQSIRGKTVAIIGIGSIGSALGRLLQPFGVNLIGVKRTSPEVGRDYPPFAMVTNDPLSAANEADIAVVTLPLTADSRGLIGAEFLRIFGNGLIVNVGRGEVIEEEALYHALRDGTIAGAAIDTWYQYPTEADSARSNSPSSPTYPSRFPFHELPNVLLSPHVGGYTAQATIGMVRDAVREVRGFIDTGRFTLPLDLTAGY